MPKVPTPPAAAALAERLARIEAQHKAEIAALLDGDAGKSSDALAAIGGQYRVGSLLLPPLTIGRLFLLARVEGLSDRLTSGHASVEDIARTLYILVRGTDAIQPLMDCDHRLQLIEADRVRLGSAFTPAMAEVWTRHRDAIVSERIAKFDAPAMQLLTDCGARSLDEVRQVLDSAINAALDAFAPIAKGDDPQNPLKPARSRLSGWPGSLIRSVLSTAGLLITRSGRFRLRWPVTCSAPPSDDTAARS